jgi:3D (Asp-Asp-Asp) domain-containing protein
MLHHAIVMLVTQYCLTGRTASGTRTHFGTAAIDRLIWRFGTHFYIPKLRRSVVAEDTGGYISGYHIDVWTPSCREAIQWGSQRVLVYVGS